jgi:glycosyltransferase involved in cell wall biosynthesis
MKVFFNRYPRNQPYGGGNQFLQKMTSMLSQKGHDVVYHLEEEIDIIFMIDPRPGDHGYSIQHIWNYKQSNPKTKILHRVNECDARKGTNEVDEILLLGMSISDKIVFISSWLQEYFHNLADPKIGLKERSRVIYNGCDTNHFYPTKKERSDKIKLVTHHWSDNWMKGFDLYTEIDKYLIDNPNAPFDFTYIGRYCKEYLPKKTNLVSPLHGKELGDELRKYDIYVTASRWEPCGMHHIEGAASGMPVLYHKDSGGIVELCQNHGEAFSGFDSFLESLSSVAKNYSGYVDKIDHGNLSLEKCCNQFYSVIQETHS